MTNSPDASFWEEASDRLSSAIFPQNDLDARLGQHRYIPRGFGNESEATYFPRF